MVEPIRAHRDDNVAVALEPVAHKVAVVPIAEGAAVLRYGQVIGYAVRPIPAGGKVGEDDLSLPAPPRLEDLAVSDAVAAPLAPLEGISFEGYENPDGSAGTR